MSIRIRIQRLPLFLLAVLSSNMDPSGVFEPIFYDSLQRFQNEEYRDRKALIPPGYEEKFGCPVQLFDNNKTDLGLYALLACCQPETTDNNTMPVCFLMARQAIIKRYALADFVRKTKPCQQYKIKRQIFYFDIGEDEWFFSNSRAWLRHLENGIQEPFIPFPPNHRAIT